MPNITVTEAAAVIPTIVAAQTLGKLASNMVLTGLVNRDYDNEIAQYGQTVSIGRRGTLSANDKLANATVTRQSPMMTATTVTLNRHKEVTIATEDVAIMLARPDLITGYAEDAALALLEQIEADLASLYVGFSQSINATTGLTDAHFREAQRLLNAAKAPTGQRYAVLHEDAYAEASALDELISAHYQGDAAFQAVKNGLLGMYAGFEIYLNQNVRAVSGECKNLFMHRNSVVLATRPMRVSDRRNVEQVVQVENGIGLRTTMTYDANMLAEQMTIDILYGTAELRDDHGVVVRTTEVI